MSYKVAIEIYVLLAIINTMLFVTNQAYEEGFPGQSLRSPFNIFPISTTLEDPADTNSRTDELIFNSTNPTNSSGSVLDWVIDGLSDFTAQIAVILDFVKFFTAGYVVDLLNSMGFPGDFIYLATVPFAIYVAYMTFVMITNRLGN